MLLQLRAAAMSLYSEQGDEVPIMHLTADALINRSIVLYGASGSGKTAMIRHILDLLRGRVPQGILVSPSEPSNQSYVDYFPQPLIHYSMKAPDPKTASTNPNRPQRMLEGDKGAMQFITNVWDRQEIMVQTYKAANDPKVLKRLASRLPKAERDKISASIAPIRTKLAKAKTSIQRKYRNNRGDMKDKTREAEDLFQDVECKMYKMCFMNNFAFLWDIPDLADDERTSLTYINFNPHTVLVLDDCGADLKPIMKQAVFKNLFYRARHARLTVIQAYQDPTDLTAALRRNAFVSIFCDRASAQSHVEQKSNNFSKDVKKGIGGVLNVTFGAKFRKLAYIRDDPAGKNFYHVTASPAEGEMFPCQAILDVCAAIKREAGMTDIGNPFFTAFSVK
jgi:hypothetical protein